MYGAFCHRESFRTIVFGPGAVARGADLIGEGYILLSTQRAIAAAPAILERAAALVEVPAGPVDVLAAELRATVAMAVATAGGRTGRLLALGGGRVIDVAKALAAADPPREVVAVPTTLSGAEMTGGHRHARGVAPDTPRVRPVAVINDPALSASQPAPGLAASSANALGHALTAIFADRTTPIARAVAREGVRQLADGWSSESVRRTPAEPDSLATTEPNGPTLGAPDHPTPSAPDRRTPAEPDRIALALGALLAGWAVDQSGLGPHHALAQSAVRIAALGHARANAALLPATVRLMRIRRAEEYEQLDALLSGEPGTSLELLAERLRERAGANLGTLVEDEQMLERMVQAAAQRMELERIPPAPDREEIREMYRASA